MWEIHQRDLRDRLVVQMLPSFFFKIELLHHRQPLFAVRSSSPTGTVFSTTHPVTQEPLRRLRLAYHALSRPSRESRAQPSLPKPRAPGR